MAGKPLKSSWLMIGLRIGLGVSLASLLTRESLLLFSALAAANSVVPANQSRILHPKSPALGPATSFASAVTTAPSASAADPAKATGNTRADVGQPAGLAPYRIVHILCTGISDYPGEWTDLAYGEKDAQDISSTFSNRFGFQVHGPLLGKRATKANILAAMDSIGSVPEDDVIIFYSGHGATLEVTNAAVGSTNRYARFGFLVPYDPDLRPKSSFDEYTNMALDMRLFVDRLRHIPARHRICLIDSCFSASGISFVNPRNKMPNDRVKELLGKPTVQVITTGAELEEAPARPIGAENSLLTHAVIKVLESGGIQTGDEVYFQVRKMVREMARMSSFTLNPQRRYLEESSGDFVFIPPSKRNQWTEEIVVANETAGKGYYRSVSEEEVASARAAAESGGKEDDPQWSGQIDRLETRASMGDANAAAVLVHLYGRGVGTHADDRRAYIWAREGYDTQTAAGRYALGVAFFNGYGVQPSETESKALWGLAGARMLSRYGMSPKFLEGLKLPGAAGVSGGPGPGNMGEAVGMASFFVTMFGNKPDNPLVNMDDRRKKVQERFEKLKWKDVESEIAAWKNDVRSLTTKVPGNGAEQLKRQMQELQDFLLKELSEMQSSAHDRLKNATQNSLNRVQEKLGTIQTSNQPK